MTAPVKHYTASAIILSDGQPRKALLLHHRKHGKWLPPGGHQEAYENSLEAVIRETREETGLDIAPYLPAPQPFDANVTIQPLPAFIQEQRVPAHGIEPEHYHLDMNYVVRIPEQTVRHAAVEAHDIRWFTLDEINTLDTFEDLRAVLIQELSK